MEVIGTVVRLQVQRSRLKPGERGARVYDPSPLLEVPALQVGPRGVIGQSADGPVLDVHHAEHPDSRNVQLVNGLSLVPRAHYAQLRRTYGPHLVEGVAGESLLLDTESYWSLDDLAGPLHLEGSDGELLVLVDPAVAAPCVEFSRFCLGRGVGPVDDDVRQAMSDLDGGVRGFYVRADGSARIELGARLFRG